MGRARDAGADRALRRRRRSPDEGEIGPFERPGAAVVGELRGEARVRPVVLRDHHQARGVLVEPVHDPRPPDAADAGQAVAAMGEQRVDQRAALVTCRGMDHEPGRLVDDDEVAVLVDDAERDRLRCRLGRDRRRARRERWRRPGTTFADGSSAVAPSTVTRPSRISTCRRERERSGQARASTRSRRSGEASGVEGQGAVHDGASRSHPRLRSRRHREPSSGAGPLNRRASVAIRPALRRQAPFV